MARDRRFVDVFDFKSFLTSPARAPAGRVLHTYPKHILAIYHDATPQSDRSVCRRRCAKRLAEIKQGAGLRAHLRSLRIRFGGASNYYYISMVYRKAQQAGPAALPTGPAPRNSALGD